MLDKDGDQIDRLCEKLISITNSQGEEYPTYNKKKSG
jgi:hypothetical protein